MSNAAGRTSGHSWIGPLLLLLILIVLIALFVAKSGWQAAIVVKPKLAYDNYSSLFVNLFVVTVLVERFIEVFNSILRREQRLVLLRKVQNAATDADRATAQQDLDVYRSQTETQAMYLGFAVGLILGICGFHTLQEVFQIDTLIGPQKAAFIAMDIVLTAGLIAGGSKGINAVTSLIGEVLRARKEESETKKPNP